MLSRRLLRMMSFALMVSSVLSTEAVEAWRRDLASMALVSQARKVLPVLPTVAVSAPRQSNGSLTYENRPSRVATDADEDFVDIPTFCGPSLTRFHLAPDTTALPPHAVYWSEAAAAETISFLPDTRGPPDPPLSAPPSLRAPPAS